MATTSEMLKLTLALLDRAVGEMQHTVPSETCKACNLTHEILAVKEEMKKVRVRKPVANR